MQKSEEDLTFQGFALQSSNDELVEKQYELQRQTDDLEASRGDLQQRSDELALASKYKSEFLANMSHELRTPLNSFLLLSKSLSENKKGNLLDEQIEDLRIIYDGGSGLLHLINDIMDLSKVEAGKLDVNLEQVELLRCCNNMAGMFKGSAQDKGLDFHVHCDPILPTQIETDSQRLEQILKNFLSNAFKFTPSGSVSLMIHAPAEITRFHVEGLSLESCIAISVKDTGLGVPEKKQREIFEAFQQEDGSISRNYGGTGLGLTISRELAKLLGGEIQLYSVLGEGCTFTLYLPLKGQHISKISGVTDVSRMATSVITTAVEVPALGVSGAEVGAGVGNGLGFEFEDENIHTVNTGEHIASNEEFIKDDRRYLNSDEDIVLIIEDDPDFAKVLLKIVREHDCKGIVANTGKNGLYLAMEHNPSGIMLDLGLPDMSGEKVLDQLKFHIETKHIPVHIVSGSGDQMAILNKGAFGFLQKPVNEEQVLGAIDEMHKLVARNVKEALVVESADHN
ncbi:MAG: response regulator, partial [Lentisphaeria bacterium]|nr:response regulator [Lentisphaeria bacterium]